MDGCHNDGTCPGRIVQTDHVMLQSGVKKNFGTSESLELIDGNSTALTDYDCNGDGVDDCGVWDWSKSMCANRVHCAHQYEFPDLTLAKSCRCIRCNLPEYQGTAFHDSNLRSPHPTQALAWGTFRNWEEHMLTCAQWLQPKDEGSIRDLLAYARGKGYKVRIGGTAHSAGGLITDGKDANTFVISLGEFTSTDPYWQFHFHGESGARRATVNAGWTQLHLFKQTRPRGYFVPAQTAGYFFSLGGIVANSVHGGAYNAGFINEYVTKLRVMDYSGAIRIIDQEAELRHWRCSFGLLGIILGIEFKLEHRQKLEMYSVKRTLETWNENEFWKFIMDDAEANIPLSSVPGDQESKANLHSSQKSCNGEYFVDFLNSGKSGATPTMFSFSQKMNENASDAPENGIPENIEDNYQSIMDQKVTDGWHGEMTWSEAARRDGAPPIAIGGVQLDINGMLDKFKWLGLARMMTGSALMQMPSMIREQRNKVNDGFFLTRSPAALAGAFFVKPDKAFAAMNKVRDQVLNSRSSKKFVWNLPGEFRFIRVADKATLQPMEPGLWFNAQMISFSDLAENDHAWRKEFKAVEDYWVQELGARPHMGKLWGMEEFPNGDIEPFSHAYACTIYSQAAKDTFNAYREAWDPQGLFFAGLGQQLLGPCP